MLIVLKRKYLYLRILSLLYFIFFILSFYIFRCNPDVSVPPPLNQLVIENMLRLPGLSADTLLQAIKGNTFDHVSAIYNLLVDRLEPTMPNLHSIQSIPGDYLPDGAQLEKVIIL